MRALVLLALALAAAPARAQDGLTPTAADFADATPEAALSVTWAEALGGAEAVAWALDDVAADTAGAPDEAVGQAGRARATAAVAAAATSSLLTVALQFSVALADPAERTTVYAALGEDTVALHTAMLVVAETVDPPPDDPTVVSAGPAEPVATATEWAERAAQVRDLAGRLQGAVTALGIAAE